ncbi:hypothetical protein [Bacillus mycoides]|uniref:hypothetical protein n=1 Tax=Bacillus mycoides TaxID=1405 RepID=UPI0013FD78D9|nr:hypothetical protein [Bacillus mycoides]
MSSPNSLGKISASIPLPAFTVGFLYNLFPTAIAIFVVLIADCAVVELESPSLTFEVNEISTFFLYPETAVSSLIFRAWMLKSSLLYVMRPIVFLLFEDTLSPFLLTSSSPKL